MSALSDDAEDTTMDDRRTHRIAPDVTHATLDGRVVLLKLGTEAYFSLDEVGSRIWQLLEAGEDVDAIVRQLLDEYDVEPARLHADVVELLEKLAARDLIEPAPPPAP